MNKEFWKDAGERAGKTIAQTLLTVWLVGDQMLNLWNVNLFDNLKVAVSAGVVSLLTSIVSAPAGAKGTASLTNEVHYVPEDRHL